MQVTSQTDHVAHHVIGDHVVVQSAHVGQGAGVHDQLVEDVMLETRGGGLDPVELPGRSEQLGRDLTKERRCISDGDQCLELIRGIDHLHFPGRLPHLLKTHRIDGRVNHKFHGPQLLGVIVTSDHCVASSLAERGYL